MTRRFAPVVLYAGIAGIVAVASKLHASTLASFSYDFTNSFRLPWAIGFASVVALAAHLAGFPDHRRPLAKSFGAASAAVGIAALMFLVVQFAVGDPRLPRLVILGSVGALVPWLVLSERLHHRGRAADTERDRVVMVVHPDEAGALADELQDAERPVRVVATLTPEEAAPPGCLDRVERLVREEEATLLVLDRTAQARQVIVDQAARLHADGVRVRTLSLFYEGWLGKLPIGELERMSLLFDIGEVHRRRYGRQRRVLDLVFGLLGLIPLLLVTPLVLVGNRIGNRGPLLFRQERVGHLGETFTLLKFRSMRPDSGDSTSWTSLDDPRITPFGAFLRRSHIDELPQMLSILGGSLSLVGPRPEQPHYVDELAAKLPYYNVRHLVRPGLTGWAQVKRGYAGDERDALEKLQFEFFYLRHQSFTLDLRILFRTARTVLLRGGR